MNPTVPRAELVAMCERLDHDPDRVSRIVITAHKVTVEYVHAVVGNGVDVDLEPAADDSP